MLRRDDLIGLLRELDGAMSAVAPPAGHEARLRERLGGLVKRKDRTRPAVLVLCAAAGALSVWLGWQASREPDAALPPMPAPSGSSRVVGEPPPAPSGSSTAAPRWTPRPVPVLPVLPLRSERSRVPETGPLPGPAPRDERPRSELVEARNEVPFARDTAAPAAPAPSGAPPSVAARSRAPAWQDVAAGPESRASGPASMGAVTSDGHRAAAPLGPHESGNSPAVSPTNGGAPANGGSPANAGNPGETRPPRPGVDTIRGVCGANEVDMGGKCMPGEDLAYQAAMLCKSMGMGQGMILPSSECDSMGPGARMVHCCAPAPKEPKNCEGLLIGDPAICADADSFKQAAVDACAAIGLGVAELGLFDDCGGGQSTQAKVLCCGPDQGGSSPDEPPPPAGAVGDGATCTADEKLEKESTDVCDENGLPLIGFYPAEDCGSGVSSIAKYVCGK